MVGGGKEQAMSGSHLYLLSAYIGDLTLCDVGRTDATSLRHRTDSDPKSVCLSFEESQYGIFFQGAFSAQKRREMHLLPSSHQLEVQISQV